MADNRRGGNPLRMFHERVPVRREPVPLVTDAPPEPQPWQEGLVRDPLEALVVTGRVRRGPSGRAD
jgi:hypothetical protein